MSAAEAIRLTPTPAQTIGPFYGYALPFERGGELVNQAYPGSIRLHGTVADGNGDLLPDVLLEIWQPDENGQISQEHGSLIRDGYTFTGWGRVPVDNAGHYTFTTVNPGVPQGSGAAPFIAVVIFGRGLMNKLHTRVYLPENTEGLAKDPLLSSLTEAERRTLIATREADGGLRWDIRLQGGDETVFLSYTDPAAAPAPGN